MASLDPYDELPYRSLPVEWTAPERLALASLLHGGPRTPLHGYRVLELGCANGANLLPLAFYRRHASFVGVDGARSQIEVANAGKSRLALSNIEFVATDLLKADQALHGQFDYIIAHGIFSWIPQDVRDALLRLCAGRLRRGGLLYLNYNSNPGWKVRGMVRDLLMAHTAGLNGLKIRAQSAQALSAKIVSCLTVSDHAYSKLIADEFKFVSESDLSYVAHEYLATDNHPYWRSEFITLAGLYGLEFVADADFNYSSGRVPEDVAPRLLREEITGYPADDIVDLLCYRQLHSPILTTRSFVRHLPTQHEFAALFVASCLEPCAAEGAEYPMFQHPSGYRVEAKAPAIQSGFEILRLRWPRGLRVGGVFPDLAHVMEDLRLLHRTGLIELRCVEPCDPGISPEPLKRLESDKGDYFTTEYHTRIGADT